MSRIAAVILAGGKGERLGGALKANIEIGGQRLLQRVGAALAGIDGPVLVAHGGHDPALLQLPPDYIPLPDLPGDYAGPLAGVAAAVGWCTAQAAPPEFLLSVAVDTPFFPADFAARASAAIGNAGAAIAGFGGQDYPTNGLWRLARIATLPADVTAGTAPHSLKRLAAAVDAITVDWTAISATDPFANVNTPEDLAELTQQAASAPRR